MKRVLAVLIPLALLGACEAPKPWSPYDKQTNKTGTTMPADNAIAKSTAPSLDIGDAEQGIFVEAKVAKDSMSPNMKAEEVLDRRKYVQSIEAKVSGQPPAQFWLEYTLKCSRDFDGQPVVLRADVKVNNKPVDKIIAVLGAQAQKNSFSKKVDILAGLKPMPSSVLATVEGELLLMPPGTAEGSVNPETATSTLTSRAIQATLVRTNFESGAAAEPGAAAAAPAPAPSQAPAAPAPAAPAPAPAQ